MNVVNPAHSPHEVTAVWPDGTEQVLDVWHCRGLAKRMPDGTFVRPVFRYAFDLEAVAAPARRENLRRQLRRINAIPVDDSLAGQPTYSTMRGDYIAFRESCGGSAGDKE